MAESQNSCQQSPTPAAAAATGATLTGLPPPRLLRSPSHESVSTELSLFSISSAASEMSRAGLRVVLPPHLGRGPSPTPETRHRLQVSSQVSPNIQYPLSFIYCFYCWYTPPLLLLLRLLLQVVVYLLMCYLCFCYYCCRGCWDVDACLYVFMSISAYLLS